MEPLVLLIVIGTSIWVAVAASSLGVGKGLVSGAADMGPMGWLCACLLLWIVAFPMYLAKRPRLIAASQALQGHVESAVVTGVQGPGWYPDPRLRAQLR